MVENSLTHRLLLLWIHSLLLVGVRATGGWPLARILITIGIVPAREGDSFA